MSVVFVDVDGTLLEGPSSERLFVSYLIRRGEIGPKQLCSAMMFVPRWGLRCGGHTLKKNKAYLAGVSVANVRATAEAFVREELADRLRPSLVGRLEGHRRAGDVIVLLTGTLEYIAAPLAALVGADRWRATECAIEHGRIVSEPPNFHPFCQDKVRVALDVCTQLGADLADCWAYGDAVHDLPLLSRVGRPVAVDPDRRLRRIARRQGWEVLPASSARLLRVASERWWRQQRSQ